MNFNPWHQVSIGQQPPAIINSIIEIPKGSKAKYEMDKETGMLRLDRVLFSSVYYPANYGFIPQTLGKDHDPLDILVFSQIDLQPLCIVQATVIGVMRMLDNGEEDDKIIAVATNDISVSYIQNIQQLPPHLTVEIKNFFEDYKKLENRTVSVEGFQDIKTATKIINISIADYKAKYSK